MDDLLKLVNKQLSNINLKIAKRYDYIAIDICDKHGRVLSTLSSGLSKRQAYDILNAIATILQWERYLA